MGYIGILPIIGGFLTGWEFHWRFGQPLRRNLGGKLIPEGREPRVIREFRTDCRDSGGKFGLLGV